MALHLDTSDPAREAHVAKLAARAARLRHPGPAPEGVQDWIVQSQTLQKQSCFNAVCEEVDSKNQPLPLPEQKYRWDYFKRGAPAAEPEFHGERHTCPDAAGYHETFDLCCLDYATGLRGTTDLTLPPRCQQLWSYDTDYYFNRPTSLAQSPRDGA